MHTQQEGCHNPTGKTGTLIRGTAWAGGGVLAEEAHETRSQHDDLERRPTNSDSLDNMSSMRSTEQQ